MYFNPCRLCFALLLAAALTGILFLVNRPEAKTNGSEVDCFFPSALHLRQIEKTAKSIDMSREELFNLYCKVAKPKWPER